MSTVTANKRSRHHNQLNFNENKAVNVSFCFVIERLPLGAYLYFTGVLLIVKCTLKRLSNPKTDESKFYLNPLHIVSRCLCDGSGNFDFTGDGYRMKVHQCVEECNCCTVCAKSKILTVQLN